MSRITTTNVENFNDQSLREEIANSITHGLGALLAVTGTAVLLVYASLRSDAIGIVSCAIYGFSMIVLFCMSTLYHAFTNIKAKRVFQVLDHCSVFILIFGTYTPLCLSALHSAAGWTAWGINAFLMLAGITANVVSGVKRWHRLSLVLYLLMGWSIAFAIRPLIAAITWNGFCLLLAGGLAYSIGVIFYVIKGPRYMHSIWHIFVLAGAVLHYFVILHYIIL